MNDAYIYIYIYIYIYKHGHLKVPMCYFSFVAKCYGIYNLPASFNGMYVYIFVFCMWVYMLMHACMYVDINVVVSVLDA